MDQMFWFMLIGVVSLGFYYRGSLLIWITYLIARTVLLNKRVICDGFGFVCQRTPLGTVLVSVFKHGQNPTETFTTTRDFKDLTFRTIDNEFFDLSLGSYHEDAFATWLAINKDCPSALIIDHSQGSVVILPDHPLTKEIIPDHPQAGTEILISKNSDLRLPFVVTVDLRLCL